MREENGSKRVIFAVLFFSVILSLSFVSAGFFSDLWGKITGEVIYSEETKIIGAPEVQKSLSCVDTDKGKNYYVKGTTSWCPSNDAMGMPCSAFIDNCLNGVLREGYCSETDSIKTEEYVCPNGCDDGACKSSDVNNSLPRSKCVDSNDSNWDSYCELYEGESIDEEIFLEYIGIPPLKANIEVVLKIGDEISNNLREGNTFLFSSGAKVMIQNIDYFPYVGGESKVDFYLKEPNIIVVVVNWFKNLFS